MGGQIRSRDAGRFGWKQRSRIEQGAPIVEVDKNYTAGQTAEAIIGEVGGGLFADSLGAYYRKYKVSRTGSPEGLQKWRQEAAEEAAQQASVLAELYFKSLASLTPAGDLVVAADDLAENGPQWSQLAPLVPWLGTLAVGAVIFRLGRRTAKVRTLVARKLGKLKEAVRKRILLLASKAKNDDEAASIIKREVEAAAGTGQIHHPISKVVHDALEKHKNLRGKYQYRDPRFEAMAKDLESHVGRQDWHIKTDKKIANWLDEFPNANEDDFEQMLKDVYSSDEMKKRFPHGY